MSQTYRISGNTNIFHALFRGFILIASVIGGIFMLVFSAAVAFFILAGIAIFGLAVFVFFWVRAKLTNRPFGPKANFEAQRKAFEAQFSTTNSAFTENAKKPNGPIIDAHETPQGWSVDD